MVNAVQKARVGSKWSRDYRPLKDIAADIRADVKATKQAGGLPKDLKVSVRTDLFSGGGAIRVTLSGWDKQRVYEERADGYLNLTEEARQAQEQVEAIRLAYNKDESDPTVDYFNVTYYGSTDWDWRLRQ
jgi:hypothetical protein